MKEILIVGLSSLAIGTIALMENCNGNISTYGNGEYLVVDESPENIYAVKIDVPPIHRHIECFPKEASKQRHRPIRARFDEKEIRRAIKENRNWVKMPKDEPGDSVTILRNQEGTIVANKMQKALNTQLAIMQVIGIFQG